MAYAHKHIDACFGAVKPPSLWVILSKALDTGIPPLQGLQQGSTCQFTMDVMHQLTALGGDTAPTLYFGPPQLHTICVVYLFTACVGDKQTV